jgi:MarR family 2-MHQ and catechol resistance regulon transcriptional repressor
MSSPALLPILTSDPDLERDAEALYDSVSELVRVYQSLDRDRICCHDISITQCNALEALARRGGLTLGELAAHLYLDKSTASRVVDALQRKGYVDRTTHPDDGRAVRLVTTPQGKELYQSIRKGLLADEQRLLAGFDPEVRQVLPQLIARLARAVASRLGNGETCCTTD